MDETVAKDFLKYLNESTEPQTAEGEKEEKKQKSNLADVLIKMALAENIELFHDRTRKGFARIPINGHMEIWPLKSNVFKNWLKGLYYSKTEKSINADATSQSLGVLEAKALFEGQEIELNLRVASQGGAIWYDLGNIKWQAVKVTSSGWEVISKPPILFTRGANTGQQFLPWRAEKNEITKVLDFVNLKAKEEQLLFAVVLVTSLIPEIPHPVTIWHGEKGAAKSTAERVQRRLVDPAVQELQIMPRDLNELALVLYKNWCPSFDNIDGLSSAISDTLCVAATGGGISKRELYSDSEEVILNFRRCVSLNGITVAATKPDLLDRAVLFELERIPEEQRKSESEFWTEFEKVRPRIFGAMLQVLADAMRIYPTVKLDKLPRMADFAVWGYAVAEALCSGEGERFIEAFNSNKSKGNEEAISSNPVAAAIMALVNAKGYWEGTAAEMLTAIEEIAVSEKMDIRNRSWPKSTMSLVKKLKHIRSNVVDAGINLQETKDTHKKKSIYILSRKDAETLPPRPATSASLGTIGFPAAEVMRRSAEVETSPPPQDPQQKPSIHAGCGSGGSGGGESVPLGGDALDWIEGEI